MERPTIILADIDYDYLKALEWKFIDTFGNQVDLIVITKPEYFASFFAIQREAESLIISEELYNKTLKKHCIKKIIILSENPEIAEVTEGIVLGKYDNIKAIVNEATYHLESSSPLNKKNKTRLVTVCSAIGGSGKTTIALALAKSLASYHKRAFYLNLEAVQSFAYYLKNQSCLDREACQILRRENENYGMKLASFFRMEEFTYLPPLPGSMDALQIPIEHILLLLEQLKDSQIYDELIVDTDVIRGAGLARLLSISDTVLTIVKPDGFSANKTAFLLGNIDYSSKGKFLFFCNFFDNDEELTEESAVKRWHITERLERLNGKVTPEELCETDAVENLTYLLFSER